MELAKRHFRTQVLPSSGGAPVDARRPILFNEDVVISVLKPDAPDPVYFSNGDGDDLFFILEGGGFLHSAFGVLRFERYDYVCVPKGVVHRFIPDEGRAQHWLSIECLGDLHLPRQWRNDVGQLRMDAPFCHRDFQTPRFEGPMDEGLREVVVKRRGSFFGFESPESPLDVAGWDGSVYPWTFNIMKFQPRAGQMHLPPDWHGTFATRGALICSFVPRTVDFHPEAIPCPYPHSSVDCDEVIFYCSDSFTSREGTGRGSLSYHPMGIPHGPHPGSYEASVGQKETEEMAVMLDTHKPLQATATAIEIEDPRYMSSFLPEAMGD